MIFKHPLLYSVFCAAMQDEDFAFTLQIWLVIFHKWKLGIKCVTRLHGMYSLLVI